MAGTPRKDAARLKALELLETANVSSIPVPVERIAKSQGIVIQYAPLDSELSGMAFIKEGVRIIGVNALHHPNRQRFTIAHELGHHMLHAHLLGSNVHVDTIVLKRDPASAEGVVLNEIEANAFAAQLLMPDRWISEIVGPNFDFADDARVLAVAKRFKVSVSAFQYRMLT